MVDDSETDEVDPQSEDSVLNESYPYVTIAAIHLDLTYNDTGLICKAVSVPSQPSTDVAWIHIQGNGYYAILVCLLQQCLLQIFYKLLKI